MSNPASQRAASARAAAQRRERFVRKRSESAARELWAALVTNAPRPKWSTLVTHMAGIRLPHCGCVQCAAEALTEQAELEILTRAKKAF